MSTPTIDPSTTQTSPTETIQIEVPVQTSTDRAITVPVTIATIGNLDATIPPEFKQLNDNLYNKISMLVGGGGQAVDILKNPTLMLTIVGTALAVVRTYRDANGNALGNMEQKTITLTLIQCVIADLSKAGVIKQEDAVLLINNSNLFFGIAIDAAFATAGGIIKVGEEIVETTEELITDAKTMGCSASCKKNCCGCNLF